MMIMVMIIMMIMMMFIKLRMDHDHATVWEKGSNQVHDLIMMIDNSIQNSRTLLGRDAVRLPYCMYSIDSRE